MNSYRLSAAAAAVVMAVGCGGGGTTGPANQAPTANFNAPTCTLLNCTFTDASTDADGNIASRVWTFESGTPATSTTATQAVSFPAAGTYTVMLTATDNDGATGNFSRDVTVADVPGNTSPTAEFTFACTGLDCTFTDASTDADAGDGIASWSWNFGESGSATNTSTTQNPTHTYAVTDPTTAQVTLMVTDNNGGTGSVTKDVAVTPPGGLTCDNGSGTFASCALRLDSQSKVTITLTTADCTAKKNTLAITAPIQQTVFADGCNSPIPGTPEATITLNNGAPFDAGTDLQAQVTSGSKDPNRIPPQVRVSGVFPNWTLNFDDGENPTGPGEPDFNDLIFTVNATAP